MQRDFKGVWIPKEIWLDDNLGWSEKLLLVEVDSLASNEKGCFATNDYFSDFFKLSKDRISKLISSLKNKGYIEVELKYKKGTKQIEERLITTRGYRQKQLEGIVENNDRGIVENAEDNNTIINNTENNTYNNCMSAIIQEIDMLLRVKNLNVKPQVLLRLAEGDSELVIRQIKTYGDKGVAYLKSAIKDKYVDDRAKTEVDPKTEFFTKYKKSISVLEVAYNNNKFTGDQLVWAEEILRGEGRI